MALALGMKEEDLAMAEIEEPRCNGAAVRQEMVEPRKVKGREGQGMKVKAPGQQSWQRRSRHTYVPNM